MKCPQASRELQIYNPALMEGEACKGCGSRDLELDQVAGFLACLSCGLVNEETRLESHGGGGLFNGVFVAQSDTGVLAAATGNRFLKRWSHIKHGFLNRDDRRKIHVQKRLQDLSSLLRLPKEKMEEVKHIIDCITEGHWAQGAWTDLLVGSCIYVVARQSCFPLTIVDVADAVQRDLTEIARMSNRIVDFMNIQLPQIDPNSFLERAIFGFPPFEKLQKDLLRKLFKEGQLLLQYALQWFLTTGRHLLPVLVPIIVIVAGANEVKAGLDELSKMLRVNIVTARSRLKEFKAELVNVGGDLPWGKDINPKTLNRHMPFILQYLELKLKLQQKETAIVAASEVVNWPERCLSGNKHARTEAHILLNEVPVDDNGTESAKRCKVGSLPKDNHLAVRNGCNTETNINNESFNADEGHKYERSQATAVEQVRDDSQEELDCAADSAVLNKSHWYRLPPAFRASELARSKRRAKIDASKKRIAKSRKVMGSISTETSSTRPNNRDATDGSQPNIARTCCQEVDGRLDWEDLIIEYLVLHGADESQIEDGYYRTLLSVPPVQKETEITDESLQQYIRSEAEVAFLQALLPEETANPFVVS